MSFLRKLRPLKNPKPAELVLLTKYSDKNPGDPWSICYYAYKAVYPDGAIRYVGHNGDSFVGCNGEYSHCYRLTEELKQKWLEYAELKYRRRQFMRKLTVDELIEELLILQKQGR